jgi:Tfp pilus assembly protein PilO
VAKTTKADQLSTNNLMIVMLLISLVVIGATVLFGKSLLSSIARDTTVVQKTGTAEKNIEADLVAAPSLTAAYKSLGPSTTLLADALPATPDFPSILVTFETMARTAGMSLHSIDPAGTAGTAPIAQTIPAEGAAVSPVAYPLSVSLNGTFASFQKFMMTVETSARPMRITDIKVSGSGSTTNIEATIETYYQGAAALPLSKEYVK